MSENKIKADSNVCRTCLSKSDNYISVFNVEQISNEILTLSEMIFLCTDLEIIEDDGLPNKICSRCHLDIIQAFSFRKRSQNADIHLKRINKTSAVINEENNENNSYNYNDYENNIMNSVECEYKDNENDETIDLNELSEKMMADGQINSTNYGWEMNLHDDPSEVTENEPENNTNNTSKIKLEELNFNCPICKKSFPFHSQLMAHIQIHSEEKPHKCDYCHQRFRHSLHLQAHIKTHVVEKPYKCEFCPLRFKLPFHLKRHSVLHSGIKPYQCEICFKSFPRKDYLQRHIRVHESKEQQQQLQLQQQQQHLQQQQQQQQQQQHILVV